MDLFRTTNKGINLSKDLGAYTNLSRSFYGYSMGLEIMFLLFFVGVFSMSIYRSIKKMKDSHFNHEVKEETEVEYNDNEAENGSDVKETNDNLIYKFDEDEQDKDNKIDDKNVDDDVDSEAEYEKEHDENEERFFEIDHQVSFMGPFLIGHIVSNSLFAADYISIIMMVGGIICFILFNVLKIKEKIRWLSVLFMLPAIGSFIPFFISNHKISG